MNLRSTRRLFTASNETFRAPAHHPPPPAVEEVEERVHWSAVARRRIRVTERFHGYQRERSDAKGGRTKRGSELDLRL